MTLHTAKSWLSFSRKILRHDLILPLTEFVFLYYADFESCLSGPDGGLGDGCRCFDDDDDNDVDLKDLAAFQEAFTG